MANALAYYEAKPYDNDTISGSTRIVLPSGLGNFNQITVSVVVGGVTGGSDAIDFDLDTSFTRDAFGVDTWTELVSMTQATAATSETKILLRSDTVSWADRCSLEVTVASGATATGVCVTVVGSNAVAAAAA